MSDFFKKIAILFISVCVLFSTLTYSVTYHYCKGEVAEVAYFVKSKGCASESNLQGNLSCEVSETACEKSCCEDVTKVIESSIFTYPKVTEIYKSDVVFASFLEPIYSFLFTKIEFKNYIAKPFPPPDSHFNYQTLYQVFII